jgi:predicted component of type VI protein secretion system
LAGQEGGMKSYSIGRGEENDIVILDDTVSRQHAELIDQDDGTFRLRDLGSINGTFYFGKDGWVPTTFGVLEADEPVRIGRWETSIAALLSSIDVKPTRKPSTEDTVPRR